MDFLRCLQAAGSKVIQVDQLYQAGADEGNLWESPGVTPSCSTVSPPPPSRCLVCFQETVYAVCNNVTFNLTMEGNGREIQIRESGCPAFMETGGKLLNTTRFPAASSGNLWWLIVIPIIILILILIGVLVYRKRRGIYRT